MKHLTNAIHKYYYALILFTFTQTIVFGQDSTSSSSTTTVTTSTTETRFVVEPWMYLAGGAILLILSIALFRGSSKEKIIIERSTDTNRK